MCGNSPKNGIALRRGGAHSTRREPVSSHDGGVNTQLRRSRRCQVARAGISTHLGSGRRTGVHRPRRSFGPHSESSLRINRGDEHNGVAHVADVTGSPFSRSEHAAYLVRVARPTKFAEGSLRGELLVGRRLAAAPRRRLQIEEISCPRRPPGTTFNRGPCPDPRSTGRGESPGCAGLRSGRALRCSDRRAALEDRRPRICNCSEGSVTMIQGSSGIDPEESAEGKAPASCCRCAAASLLALAVLIPTGAAEAGERRGPVVQLESSEDLAQAVLLHRGSARGAGSMRALRAELVGLRQELAQLGVDPSPDRVGRALGHRDAAASLLPEAVGRAPARPGEPTATRPGPLSPEVAAPGGPGIEAQVRDLLSEIDQVLADPVGQRARLELVQRRLDDALGSPARRGGLSSRLMPEGAYNREELRHRKDLRP